MPARRSAWDKLTPEERGEALNWLRFEAKAHRGLPIGPLLMALADHVDPPKARPRSVHAWPKRSGNRRLCPHCGTRRRRTSTKGMPWEYLAPGLDAKKANNWTKTRPNCTGRGAKR